MGRREIKKSLMLRFDFHINKLNKRDFLVTMTEYDVELEYHALGPVSATASTDGTMVVIDFLSAYDQTKVMRLIVPSSNLQNYIDAISAVQKALEDPASGIHLVPDISH